MQDIVVRFNGQADFANVRREIAKLQAQYEKLGATMAAVRKTSPDPIGTYQKQMAQLAEMRNLFNDAAMASGQWHVQTVKNISASERLTQQIQKQKLTWGEMRKELRAYRNDMRGVPGSGGSSLREAIREQQALRNAMASQMTGSVFGKNNTDLLLPRNLGPELDNARVKYGMINQMIASAAHQTVNWGKNTQWAGRQIMVGLTVPLGIAAVGAAALAKKVDEELTRIAKVYDTFSTTASGKERELATLREQSMQTATRLAKDYGMAIQDTLEIQAQLAATGLNGAELFQATSQAARIATLGEMDYQEAIDMTIALQTAFKLNTQELADTFNFMNSVENATSMGIQDIAEAIPRAASAMAALNVKAEEMTVMLTAMKEAGVDPAEAANALKSGATRILDPTAEAVAYWKDVLQKDLPQIVQDAGGNMFEFIKQVSVALHGLDPQVVQTAIAKTFGTYQFNRITALITNMGDAMTGTANQTAKAFEILGQSTDQWAQSAETELERLQNSISLKFKAAVESLKASLVPFGMTVLQALTPVIEFVTYLFEKFNALPGAFKTAIMILLGLGAVAGPLLMITGIFANLFGNVIKGITSLTNLRYRFKALSAEEAAAAITARNAKSAFDSQAQSVAVLAQNINGLTAAMEHNAIASGQMMSATGMIGGGGFMRQVIKNGQGDLVYAGGSRNTQGVAIGGLPMHDPRAEPGDAARWQQAQIASAAVANNTQNTARNMASVGKAVGAMAALPLIFAAAGTGASGMLDTMINIAMIAGTISIIFPGAFSKAFGLLKGIGKLFSGQMVGKAALFAASLGGIARAGGGPKELAKAFGQMAPRFTQFAKSALKVFGPLGLLALGVIAFKKMHDEMTELNRAQADIGKSAESWSSVLGFTYAPGQIDGGTNKNNMASRKDEVDALREANEGLADSLERAGAKSDEFASAYKLAVSEALKVVSNGGTADQARQAFEVALQTAGASDVVIERLRVQFDKIDLDDPKAVAMEIRKQITDALNELPAAPEMQAGFWEKLIGQTEITDESKATARRIGQQFAEAFFTAATPEEQGMLFNDLEDNLDEQFSGAFRNIFNQLTPEVQAEFERLGIDSMSALNKHLAGMNMSDATHWLWDRGLDSDMDELESYRETIKSIYEGMLDDGLITQEQYSRILEKYGPAIRSFGQTMTDLELPDIGPRLEVGDAMSQWGQYLDEARAKGRHLSEEEKLLYLNQLRLRAGMDLATSSTQGFATEAEAAAAAASAAAGGVDALYYATDDLVNAQKSAMSGAWGDVLEGANRMWEESRQNAIDNMRDAGEATQKALEDETKAMQDEYDRREEAQEAAHEAQIKRVEDERDAVDKAYQSRIDKLHDSIDAEKEAEDNRQRIFEREQQRIERTANRLNSAIDFNVALNSGNLDEAAKIANDISASEQKYAFDDADREAKDRSEARQRALEDQIDRIEDEREKRKEAYEERLDQIKETQEAQEKALKREREMAEEAMQARKDAAQEATDAAVESAQDALEADRRSLADRLRALQEFVPQNEEELREHTAEVEAIYREYGIDLTGQGKEWADVIGNALDTNVAQAAANLQTQIKWQQIAKNIADQIGEGMGMTADQVVAFLKTGVFPAGSPVSTKPWFPITSAGSTAKGSTNGGPLGPRASFHSGGKVGYTGGQPFSQADRVGVRRSASTYPSEVPTLLKTGEYVVKANAARRHRDLLDSINEGRPHGLPRHAGGPIGTYVAGMYGLGAAMATKMWEVAAAKKIEMAMQQQAAAQAGSSAGLEGGGSIWERLFATVKRFFPRANLNSAYRPGDPGYHGAGMAVDLGEQGFMGGLGRPYLAAMNQWIYDNYRGSTELIYDGLGDNRPDLKNGANHVYSASTQAEHMNHVHWAMDAAAAAAAGRAGIAGLGAAPSSLSGNAKIVQDMASRMYGWVGAQWDALYRLVMKESGFRNTAQNPTSTAYGMFQFLDSTWAGYGVAKTSDPTMQTLAGLRYISARYGTPANALAFHNANNWYDAGGFLMPGRNQMVSNGTGKPEPVFTAAQWDILKSNIGGPLNFNTVGRRVAPLPVRMADVDSGSDSVYNVNIEFSGPVNSEVDVEGAVERVLNKIESKRGRRRVISAG